MATTATATPATVPAIYPKEQFLNAFEMELATTLKVLRAFPAGNETLQPAPKSRNARDLAFIFVGEMAFGITALTTGFDWTKPPTMPAAPETIPEIITVLEETGKKMIAIIQGHTDEQLLSDTVLFPTAPGKMSELSKLSFLWMNLCDMIHHRGQFSVYLRIAGGKLPSIYGPTADEPWM